MPVRVWHDEGMPDQPPDNRADVSRRGLGTIPPESLIAVVDGLGEYICIHDVDLDEFGEVADCRLRAWNAAYEKVRTRPVHAGQRITEEYFKPEIAMEYVNIAWKRGSVQQVFEYTPEMRDLYRPERAFVFLTVRWQRIGDFLVEVGSDLSDLRGLELDLASKRSALVDALRAQVQAEERERLARELHDSTVQRLFAACLYLNTMAREVEPERGAVLTEIAASLSAAIEEVRFGILELRNDIPSTLELELNDAVRPLLQASGVVCNIHVEDVTVLDDEIRANLRSIVREAVTNAVKHGKASSVTVTVLRDGYHLVLRVADDGLGFAPNAVFSGGVHNMRQRAERLGGSLELFSGERGTTVIWRVPLPVGAT